MIIDPSASIKIFNPPDPPEICLEIGEGSHIYSNFSILRPSAKIRVGKNCQLGRSIFISANSIEVGNDVIMAWGVTIMDTDSHALCWDHRKNDVEQCRSDYLDDRDNLIKNKDWTHVASAPIKIGNKTWIGFNAAILKGVAIEEEAVIGAQSVVLKNIPPKTAAAGNPAVVVKSI